MPANSSGKVAIVGVDESDRIGVVPDKSILQLHAEGARNALRDAGLTLKDVDGMFTANIPPTELGEYLGIEPKVVDGTNVGGCILPDPRRPRGFRDRQGPLRGGAHHPRRERPIRGRDAAAR